MNIEKLSQFKTLKSKDHSHDWKEDWNHTGKTHILDEVCLDEDYSAFYALGICGTQFKHRTKYNNNKLNISKGVDCFKCMLKAGYFKYDSPTYLDSMQIGNYYIVQIAFAETRHRKLVEYEVGDTYEYLFRTV